MLSHIFRQPGYQAAIAGLGNRRGVPDVAFDASSIAAAPLVWSRPGHPYLVLPMAGTSAGAPPWAGIAALADQYAKRRLGLLNPAIYRIGETYVYRQAFHDVIQGNNTVTISSARGRLITVKGFVARPGWDAVTGWGTPRVAELVPLLSRLTPPFVTVPPGGPGG